MDIGLYHIATRRDFSGRRKEFYTVTDYYGDVHIYQNPYGKSQMAIRFLKQGIERAFVAPDLDRELEVDGEYPDFYIQGVIS